MVRGGLTERVEQDRTVRLRFTNVGKLPPPVLQVRAAPAALFNPCLSHHQCACSMQARRSAVRQPGVNPGKQPQSTGTRATEPCLTYHLFLDQ